MTIIQKSIHIIDYENRQVVKRETQEAFESYVSDLISSISNNDTSGREYKTRSNATEVIGSILALCADLNSANIVSSKMDGIAKRLLLKEVEAQEKIARTSTNVQKGSLIQALLSDEYENYFYLLANVEHTEWVDDIDFSFKTGFSKVKKTLWKSCLIDLPDISAREFHAKIYSNTVAKYWSNGFLEFDEINSDESNTRRAFKAIEAILNLGFRGVVSPDHTVIRNCFIGYLKNNDLIDYPIMVNSILKKYNPISNEISFEKIQAIRTKLLEQPQKKNFDSQFNSINSAINARIRKIYPINDGIDLKISSAIDNLPDTIQSIEDDGIKYIRIRTNNSDTYKKFQTVQLSKKS